VKKELTRRDMMSRTGMAIGGALAFGAIQACSSEDDPAICPEAQECPPPGECPDPGAAVSDFPYEKFLPSSFQIDVSAAKEAAYHGYYESGCCHGAYKALLAELQKAGAPFDKLPLNSAGFGRGGVVGYGSICGAVLGGIMAGNMVVAHGTSLNNMLTDLMRWYETFEFPQYQPIAPYSGETSGLLDWGTEASKPDVTRVAPGSHLCHPSVSSWCAGQSPMVPAGGTHQPDKKARCARLTADVTEKTAQMINAYLSSGSLGSRAHALANAAPATVTGCTGCHDVAPKAIGAKTAPPSASGMACTPCHTDSDKGTTHW
jgi:hypothetical protein